MAEFIYTIDVILVWDETSFSRDAVSADVHWRAYLAVVKTATSVDRASLISDFIEVHPFEGVISLTSVTAIVFHFAGNEHLGRYVNIGPGGITSDLNAIRER